ncbi:hypothetical protein A2886_02625 [candidate division WWE3 bacterium RIFCSPHIGHO2_01_FULL_42_13]|uniref:4a-hydroxytetrahydrobiopterin dehydratase n=1 Tax=candidate division WWE3 bacterium RIFCSPHIGHO2_01_FULL_42_13 TaxID=1802617 RepID=A0A1F4UTY0_UNCKA|nr:MAG: hypothetical protein A2886_02625 [candidate division WWE3 bacterium RIFCSPHIGHO2_01_FULL_42_13]
MLKDLNHDWKIQNNKLFLSTKQKDFMACVDLINQIAQIAEKMNHHPNLYINDYRTLEIEVYTHAENKITEKDWELAEEIDKILD